MSRYIIAIARLLQDPGSGTLVSWMRYLSSPEQLAGPHDRWLSRELSELRGEQGRQSSNHREYDLGVRIPLCAAFDGESS
eukprot:508090-Pelagomonas_calceolata.AAC.1